MRINFFSESVQGGGSGEVDQHQFKDGDSVFQRSEALLISLRGFVSSLSPFPSGVLFSFPLCAALDFEFSVLAAAKATTTASAAAAAAPAVEDVAIAAATISE